MSDEPEPIAGIPWSLPGGVIETLKWDQHVGVGACGGNREWHMRLGWLAQAWPALMSEVQWRVRDAQAKHQPSGSTGAKGAETPT